MGNEAAVQWRFIREEFIPPARSAVAEGARADMESARVPAAAEGGRGAVKTAPYRASWSSCLFILPVCRGEHCSPASFIQQRIYRKISRKKNGHGRAMLAPTVYT